MTGLLWLSAAMAQQPIAQPYMQDVTPTGAWVLWETDSGVESVVEYGPTATLGSEATGQRVGEGLGAFIHEVQLTGLTAGAAWSYRVRTGGWTSAIRTFRTPAATSAEAPTRVIVVSDMQQDGSHPDEWGRVVDDGIVPFAEAELGGAPADAIDLVLIAGDLVDNGWTRSEWTETYFGPAQALFGVVASYPVPGNHEANSPWYFAYTRVPDNGETGYLREHWWSTDRSNVRFVGLDSNVGFRTAAQLAFLDQTLDDACDRPDIDIVVGQLHHPFKSELWTPGELDWTGEVVARLEAFSTDCAKPSVHVFGHTHGYSRGQSRDHRHLWVNAASAGGAIDSWGAFPQADYDEFTVSQDEYGFVVLEIEAGDDPAIRLRRMGMGDSGAKTGPVVRDEVRLRLNSLPPATPDVVSPRGTGVSADCRTLTAGAFSDPDGEQHGGSQFELAASCDSFDSPIDQWWVQHENWYFDEDLQAGDDLTDQAVLALAPDTDYCWRVRYRDRGLVWSDWSIGASFQTGPATGARSDDLVVNGGAEDGVTGWTVEAGVLEAVGPDECDGDEPFSGDAFFAVGGICDGGPYGKAYQDVDLADFTEAIDADEARIGFGAALSDWGGDDEPRVWIEVYDADGALTGTSVALAHAVDAWAALEGALPLSPGDRTARVVLEGTRNAGVDNDSYVDDVWLEVVSSAEVDCVGEFVEAPPVEPDPDPDPEPSDPGDPKDPNACGCATGGPVGPWWLILLGWRRRSQRR